MNRAFMLMPDTPRYFKEKMLESLSSPSYLHSIRNAYGKYCHVSGVP
jgi:hypothetical protein